MHNAHDVLRASGLYSAEEVAGMLGVDRSTAYRMAADGRLTAMKVGRQWRFPADPLRALFAAAGASPSLPGVSEFDPIDDLESGVIGPVVDLAAHLLGVMMVATDMEGNPLTEVVNPCPWFSARQDDPEVLAQCVDDWRGLAQGIDFEPHLAIGSHGFECARVFIRDGSRLVGMVLAGGILPPGSDTPGLYDLDEGARIRLLTALPRVAATVSHIITLTTAPTRSMP
ncbi:MAG: helix-turn-helix domain-containing protein [Demequinaceae bacterium]|nr:helix-turn-helix domain-containing protein [Demequinaceae bacterium]